MNKAFIFDFDGVIIDSENKKFEDLKTILRKRNIVLQKNLFKSMIGKKTGAFLTEKFPELSSAEIKKITTLLREKRSKEVEKFKLIAGISNLLKYIKSKNYKIAITTGSENSLVRKILKIHDLEKYFEVFVTGEEFRKSKPDPECYEITFKKINLGKENIVVVEDSVAGIEAAKKIGLKVFGVKTYLENLPGVDAEFSDHNELLEFLKKNPA